MIICYNKTTKKIEKVIHSNNSIVPYQYMDTHIVCNQKNLIIKKGDLFEKCEDFIKIGVNKLKIKKEKYTIINDENTDHPILLEKL